MTPLPKRYSFPPHKPNLPANMHGWCIKSTQDTIRTVIGPQTKTIVELGSWLGQSTRFMLDLAPQATLYAVDHWKGSDEHFQPGDHGVPNILDVIPVLYPTFLVNCWEYRTRLVPVREETAAGLEALFHVGIAPDAIYVDAAHSYEAVKDDLYMACTLFPNAKIFGDDYMLPEVRKAVDEYATTHDAKVYDGGNGWRLDK